MFQTKDLNFGFVILSPEINLGRIICTMRSIKNNCGEIPTICSVVKDAKKKDLEQINEICPSYRAGTHFTSLLNTGMKKGHKEWNLFIVEGTIVSKNIQYKYSRFLEDENDILYAIMPDYDRAGNPTNLNCYFYDCSLNGLMIHQEVFNKVGEFTDNPLEISRTMWAYDAVRKGCRFKGVFGVKLL